MIMCSFIKSSVQIQIKTHHCSRNKKEKLCGAVALKEAFRCGALIFCWNSKNQHLNSVMVRGLDDFQFCPCVSQPWFMIRWGSVWDSCGILLLQWCVALHLKHFKPATTSITVNNSLYLLLPSNMTYANHTLVWNLTVNIREEVGC